MSRRKREDEQSTLRPAWLLRHAEQLIDRMSDTDLPRTAHPRRAVSAAYYAVFHTVCLEVAYTAFPDGGQNVWWQLCRGFGHEETARICRWSTDSPAPTSLSGIVDLARGSQDLVFFATQFVILREERERADYSHEVVIDRTSATASMKNAHDAVAALDRVGYDEQPWRSLVALMLMNSKPRSYALPPIEGS